MMRRKTLAGFALLLLLTACVRPGPQSSFPLPTAATENATAQIPAFTAAPSATSSPAPTLTPASSPTGEPLPLDTPLDSGPSDSNWVRLRPGLEHRYIWIRDAENRNAENRNAENRNAENQILETLYILRLDPAAFTFRVAYQPQGQTLETWLAQSGALIAFNGGYYRAEGETLIPTGLTIVDSQPIGETYADFAGMLAIGPAGVDLRWLAQAPYDPAEGLTSALQSFPLLVKPGGVLGFPAELEDNQPARRSVIARDRSGRFLLMAAPRGYFTLHQLSAFLVQSDLEIDIALNLDGGPSSGLLLADPPEGEPALLPLPVVILIFPQ
jgi:hypothetical protein